MKVGLRFGMAWELLTNTYKDLPVALDRDWKKIRDLTFINHSGGGLHKLIRHIDDVAELPSQLLYQCRNVGWSDEEIMENLEDAIDFLNAHFWCDQAYDIPLEMLFTIVT
jgi:hypothetical protein